MATKRQVTLRFRDEYMKASKKDKGRILDEMCSVLAIGRSTARRRLAEAGRGPVSFQPCAAFHLLHAQFSFAIVGGLQPLEPFVYLPYMPSLMMTSISISGWVRRFTTSAACS